MHETVNHGGGHGVVTEDLAPAAEGFVGADDQAGPLVSGRHQLEEQVGGLALERDVAHFVDDDERESSETTQLVLEFAGVVGGTESVDPLGGGGEGDSVSGQTGAEGIGASPRWDWRDDPSRSKQAARNSSWLHASARARSARRSTPASSDGCLSSRHK